jgi:hypothetical protein
MKQKQTTLNKSRNNLLNAFLKKEGTLTDKKNSQVAHAPKFCFVLLIALLGIFFNSCGNKSNSSDGLMPSDSQVDDAKQVSNSLTQSLPTLMVFPSDGMLERMGLLKAVENQGTTSYQRDYQQAFIKNPDLKFAIAAIQEEFAKNGFAMEDMEQQLKQISNNNAMDEMTDVARDARAELLNTVRPDYIVELDYELKTDARSRNLNKALTYSVKALDVYTNKAVSSVSKANVGADKKENDVPSLIKSDLPESMADFKKQITTHFANLLANGVEITLRVAVSKNSDVKIDDDCGDQELNERITNWLKDNALKQAFKMTKNTSTEMYFTNVRIAAKTTDGKKYTAYDFAGELNKAMKKGCSLKSKNRTQSLGDALVLIEGLK